MPEEQLVIALENKMQLEVRVFFGQKQMNRLEKLMQILRLGEIIPILHLGMITP